MALSQAEYQELSDEQLMEGVTRKEAAAFEALYERYHRRLLIFFCRMLRQDEAKAQDFLQDIFTKVVDKPHTFNGRSKFSTWMFAVAHNMVKNEYRRLRVREVMGIEQDLDVYPDPESEMVEKSFDAREFQKLVLQKLNKLDLQKRSTFLLRFQENFSITEISKIMACPEGTVKSRLFYTTKYLAEQLQAYSPQS